MVISFKNKKVVNINDKLKIIKLLEEEYTSLLTVEDSITSGSTTLDIKVNNEAIKRLVAFGEVESKTDVINLFDIITDSIPFETVDLNDKKTHRSYKCFAGVTGVKSNIIPHEDAGSSYNCLIEFLNYPKYVLVYN